MKKIHYINDNEIKNKRVLLRADFDVSLNPNRTIADDARIRQNVPTIKQLLQHSNKIICMAKLDRPVARDSKLSLQVVVDRLQSYLPDTKIKLIDDFLTESSKTFTGQTTNEIFVLENIRFYPEEKKNDMAFAKQLASLADVYVNDAFAVSHRAEASIVSLPTLLPAYAGLSLRSEIQSIDQAIKRPKRPLVAIIGGAKISSKLTLINKLIKLADYVILGGGLANVFFRAQRYLIGNSICEYEMVQKARQLLFHAAQQNTALVLPTDVIIGNPKDNETRGKIARIGDKISPDESILDIGPETQALYGNIIGKAKTIIWNGPVGLFENPAYRQGTDFIYYAIAHNPTASSIVGGGDTLAAIAKKEYLDTITHISTGGGAMLEYIENGNLPGIEALKR